MTRSVRTMVAVLAFGAAALAATGASAHGRGFGHHHHGGHHHHHFGHHHHHHDYSWAYAPAYYGGHCHVRRYVDDFDDVVVRKVCH